VNVSFLFFLRVEEQRERERESPADSPPSVEPDRGLNLTTLRS